MKSPKEVLLATLVERGGHSNFTPTQLKALLGPSGESVILVEAAEKRHVAYKYTNIAGQNEATYLVNITERGRDLYRTMQEESGVPAYVQLRELADEIERGEYDGRKPTVIVFDDGTIVRLGVSRDRAVAHCFAAAVKGIPS